MESRGSSKDGYHRRSSTEAETDDSVNLELRDPFLGQSGRKIVVVPEFAFIAKRGFNDYISV